MNISGRYFWIDTTKNGDPLELPITETLLNLFCRRLKMKSGNEALVFPRAKGIIREYRHVIDRISAAIVPDPNPDMLQPTPFKWHDARRTFGNAEIVPFSPRKYLYHAYQAYMRANGLSKPVSLMRFGTDMSGAMSEYGKKYDKRKTKHGIRSNVTLHNNSDDWMPSCSGTISNTQVE